MFYTYILRSRKNKRLYTGITNDLRRRFKEHNEKSGYGREVLKDKLENYFNNIGE